MAAAKLTPDQIRAQLKGTGKRELLELVQTMAALEKELNLSGPTTDDELHTWIFDTFGIDVPRVAVCEGHVAPFTFLADLYFVRSTAAVGLANRGGAKTFLVALLHRINAEFKTGVESLTGGATEAQSKRAFNHLDKLINVKGGEKAIVSKTKTEIIWANRCKTEIVAGTPKAFNGPHPHIVHVDEHEQMDPEAFAESRNCAISSNVSGKLIKAQNIITSTRKFAIGPMQTLVDEIRQAKLAGMKPPYDLYTWCIFEVAKANNGCQIAYPDKPACDQCDCHLISKGEWDDGSTRTLDDVCQGKFARSSGWIIWDDVVSLFKNNGREIWEAQQQCTQPSTSGVVLAQFSADRNGVTNFMPDPDDGPIYQGIDFGATNPNAVLWVQVLNKDLEARGYSGQRIVMREGSHVFFDEFYKAEIPNAILAENIKNRERAWSEIAPGFRVKGRYADPQGRAARLDLFHAGIPTTWHTDRDVKEQIKTVKELIEDKKFWVATDRCINMMGEIAYWHYPKNKKAGVMYDDPEIPVDDYDHTMSAMRYVCTNIKALSQVNNVGMPGSVGDPQETAKRLQDLRESVGMGGGNMPETEAWRLGLGSPYIDPMSDFGGYNGR